LYLGGEKLNRDSLFRAVVIAVLFFVNIGNAALPRLEAQARDQGMGVPLDAADSRAAESALVLGEAPPEVEGVNSPLVVLRMVLVLALAAAAIYGVVFFLKRAVRPPAARNPYLKVLTSASLGGSRQVYVVSLGTKAWLVGAGEGSVSLIAELTDQETLDALLLDESRRSAERAGGRFGDFRAMLRRLGGGMDAGGSGITEFSPDKLRKRRERLKGL
jgi:flagellar protein FliO/FliZ